MVHYFHSVRLQSDLCKGCTNCIKKCPTEAIRVQKSKAKIMGERCIDCGECIRVCPSKAKKAVTDSLDSINEFKYTIAIPAPALYTQFKESVSREKILSALKMIGFDDVFEVSRAAEYVTLATQEFLRKPGILKPVISSACPAVVRLIQVRYPSLIPHLLRIKSPMEVAAKTARKHFSKINNVSPEDIGIFFISPCAAKVTSVRNPYEDEDSNVDCVISIKSIYIKILNNLLKTSAEEESFSVLSSYIGIRWANSGGESLALGTEKFLAVDGIHNVSKIFDEIERGKLEDLDFIEALACTGGCIGGPLVIENPYVAKTRMKKLVENDFIREIVKPPEDHMTNIEWSKDLHHIDILTLDKDISKAMEKLEKMNQIIEELPGLDCGACGSPSCKSLAEDIVRGYANITDCIFILRKRVRELANEMMELEAKMPPVMDK